MFTHSFRYPVIFQVQGMSFLAAVLLLNMDPSDAFICFANLLNKPCQLAFFRVDHPMVSTCTSSIVDYLTKVLAIATQPSLLCLRKCELSNHFSRQVFGF